MNDSDFPEFDQAYRTVLVKDLEDKFEQLAAAANFNIYHSDIWRGTARKFAESIVKETLQVARAGVEYGDSMENAVYKYFGVETKHEP
jgi:hypothetical protein